MPRSVSRDSKTDLGLWGLGFAVYGFRFRVVGLGLNWGLRGFLGV